MTDVFISYSTADAQFARQIHSILEAAGLKAFLAEVSLAPGTKWSQAILAELRKAQWVLFLASRAAIQSPAVQQEVGGAIVGGKTVIPVIWEVRPEELPAWTKEQQAVDLRSGSIEALRPVIHRIANTVRSNEFVAGLIVMALLAVFIYAITRK